jgi:dihydroorotase/N-acyl-D-amino-acid deacylase
MRKLLLSGGTVVDGTGAQPRTCDVLLNADKIEEVGSIPAAADIETIDCTGLTIGPGFIDVHSHGDHEVLRHLPNKILQGVTTEIVGNCGFSLYPYRQSLRAGVTDDIFQGEGIPRLPGAAAYFNAVEEARPVLNVAALTGHSTLRGYAADARAALTEDEMRSMETMLEDSLAAGSTGLSTGLNCMPGGFARVDELIRLCRLLAPRGAFYTTHMRDYKFKVVEAVDEAISVATASGAPLQISHMQVVGKKNWHRLDTAIAHIERAESQGVDIAMDAYPYLAGSCSLIQYLPEWCQEGGIPELLNRLAVASSRDRIARETDGYMSNTWDDVMICDVSSERNRPIIGKSVARIAAERSRSAPETALDLLTEEQGYVFVISFNNDEEHLRKVIAHRLTSVITDGLMMSGVSHPRTFGTYPKFLGEYVREKQWMSLPEAIVKTSALAARRFRIKGRGLIAAGCFADIVVFDAARVGTSADYSDPARDPEGIHHVLVNGQLAVREGHLTGVRAGAVLRRAA